MSVLNVLLRMRADAPYQKTIDLAIDCGLVLKEIKFTHVDVPYMRKDIPPARSINKYIVNVFMQADTIETKEWFEYCVQLRDKKNNKLEEDRQYLERCLHPKVVMEVYPNNSNTQKLEVDNQKSWLP